MKYIPTVAVSAFLIRLLVTGASIGDAIALTALLGLYAYQMFVDSKTQVPVNKEILDRIIYLEEQLKEAKTKVSALSLGSLRR
jgi:hypothetical protein